MLPVLGLVAASLLCSHFIPLPSLISLRELPSVFRLSFCIGELALCTPASVFRESAGLPVAHSQYRGAAAQQKRERVSMGEGGGLFRYPIGASLLE